MAARVAAGELPVTLLAHGDEVHVDKIGSYAFGGAADGAEPMGATPCSGSARLPSRSWPPPRCGPLKDGTLELAGPVDRLLAELADRRVLVPWLISKVPYAELMRANALLNSKVDDGRPTR